MFRINCRRSQINSSCLSSMLPVVVVLVAIIAANASGQNHTRYYSPLKYWNGWPSVENMYILYGS